MPSYSSTSPPTAHLADPLVKIVEQLLTQALSLHQNPTFTVSLLMMPDSPDDVIQVTETIPTNHGRLMHGTPVKRYGCNLIVRAQNPVVGDAKARLIARLLTEPQVSGALSKNYQLSWGAQAISGSYIIRNVSLVSGPIPLGKEKEESKRYLWSINLLLSIDWYES